MYFMISCMIQGFHLASLKYDGHKGEGVADQHFLMKAHMQYFHLICQVVDFKVFILIGTQIYGSTLIFWEYIHVCFVV